MARTRSEVTLETPCVPVGNGFPWLADYWCNRLSRAAWCVEYGEVE